MEGNTYKYMLRDMESGDVMELELSESLSIPDLKQVMSDVHPDHPLPETIRLEPEFSKEELPLNSDSVRVRSFPHS